MAKKIAPRSGAETQELWDINKDDPKWRSDYNRYRAEGMSYARAVEAASRRSTGGSVGTLTPTGRKRNPKRTGPKPVVAGGGEGGQGKVKRNDMQGATKKAKTRNQGELLVKRVWREANEKAGDAWKSMTYAQKTRVVLDAIPKAIDGEIAIGVVRGLTSRATGGRGGEEAAKIISDWASSRGVRSPSAEITTAKSAGRSGRKARARRSGKGSEGISEPVSKKGREMIEGESKSRVSEVLSKVTKQQQETGQEVNWREGESDPGVQKRVQELLASKTITAKNRKKEYNRALAQALRETKPDVSEPRSERVPKKAVYKKLTFKVPVGSKKSKNKVGDQITISIMKPKTYNVPTIDGKPIVYTNKIVEDGALTDKVSPKGRRWVKIKMSSYVESLASGGEPSTPDTRQYGKPRKEGLPKSGKREFAGKMEELTRRGERGSRSFTEAALRDAYMATYEKSLSERNALRDKLRAEGKGKEAIKKALAKLGSPTVREVADAMGFEPSDRDQFALVRRVRSAIRREKLRNRMADRPEPTEKKGKRTVLRNTGEEQRRRFIESEDRRERKRQTPKAPPAVREKIMSEGAAKRVASAIVKGEKPSEADLPSAKDIRRVQRINREREAAVPKKKVDKPFSIRDAALKDLTDPKDRRAFKTIERLSEAGFTKTQVRDLLKGKKNITPSARKVAKGLGMINIATVALNFLDNLDNKKKR